MGICSPDGGGCVCDEPNHRLPEEQCKIWRDVIPTASPVMSPTIVNNQTVELSKPLAMVCSAGDRGPLLEFREVFDLSLGTRA
jgi:hypothetical protein